MTVRVIPGDMREQLRVLRDDGVRVQSIVTDPPYHLTAQGKGGQSNLVHDPNTLPPSAGTRYTRVATGFMGKAWDGGDIAFQPETWRLCWELLPPGGHLLAFSGTRTYHRMACAIEDAGFEMRDSIAWLYGSGFPKSHNVANSIDKMHGAPNRGHRIAVANRHHADGTLEPNGEHLPKYEARTAEGAPWQGYGTALKPAMELICVARKPLVGTVAANVLAHGTGALNIDGCRVATDENPSVARRAGAALNRNGIWPDKRSDESFHANRPGEVLGRWPANVVHDGSDEVVKAFPETQSGALNTANITAPNNIFGNRPKELNGEYQPDAGNASRFFYSSKADSDDRLGSKHPTVKPVDLMRWLVRLVTPPGGTVLDPFAGSGTTGMACMAEGFDCILIEREAEYVADINARIAHVHGNDTPLFRMAAD